MNINEFEVIVEAVKLVDKALGTAHIPRPLEQTVFALMYQGETEEYDGSGMGPATGGNVQSIRGISRILLDASECPVNS